MALAAAKLKASGHKCPFTTSWQSWTQLESFSAWHNVEFATKRNGFGGLDTRLAFNTPLHVRHIENLANMAKQGLFVYKGRGNAADATFVSRRVRDGHRPRRRCTATSSATPSSPCGICTLPYYPDVPGAPQNTVIGGASLWVMSGKKPAEYKGVAQFFKYLSKPEVQAKSHQRTGYLPITTAAFELTEKSGFYKQNPGTDVAVTQMIRKTTDKSRGIRLGNFVQIRTIIDEEMEQVWGGKKTAKEGLDDAVKRGNEQLERFEKANKSEALVRFARPDPRARSRSVGGRKARSLQELVAALGADRAADGHHPGVLLLAGRRRRLPERAAAGRFRHRRPSSSALENFERLLERRDLSRVVQDHGGVLGAGGRARACRSRCCWR